MKVIVPKYSLDYGDLSLGDPLFFLAGPVRGGDDWQHRMALLLNDLVPNSAVAIPCRWGDDHPLSSYYVRGTRMKFSRQLNWERHYLKEAGVGFGSGCVIFWLPKESEHSPHPGPEPYSMDTRGEIAEWRMRVKFQNARVVIGSPDQDPVEGYHGLSQIERNYSLEMGYRFPIYKTMEDTAEAALRMMRKKTTPIPGGNY